MCIFSLYTQTRIKTSLNNQNADKILHFQIFQYFTFIQMVIIRCGKAQYLVENHTEWCYNIDKGGEC